MSELPSHTLSLHRVTALPLDLDDPIYAHYSFFKLGVEESVAFYAERLAALLAGWIAGQPAVADWVLTAPACHVVPGAANLLCEAVHQLLGRRLPPGTRAALVPISESVDADALQRSGRDDYSRLGWQERLESRSRSDRLMVRGDAFAGRAVIVVNDIHVTGAQRQGMQRYLAAAGAASVAWAYIVEVDESIGRREPQLEHALNNAQARSVEELGQVLASARIRFTSKCMTRVFAHGLGELERLFAMLGAERRARILDLATREGRFDGPAFAAKMELLRAACARDAASPPAD